MWLIVYVCCVEKGLKACWIIVDVTSCLCGCELCDVMEMVISSLYVWTCHLHYSEALVLTSVMCIEKEWVLKRMYHFEGRIARRDGYYYRGSCRAPRQMKRMGITKGNVINCLCLLCWERVEGLLNHCWCNFMFVWLWTVWCYENGHLLIICVNLSSALFWGIGCDKCYVHWERMGT